MSTDATLLPPVRGRDLDDEPLVSSAASVASERSLEDVGVKAVLGAMIEQRRASRPSFPAVLARPADAHSRAARSEAFLKAR
jgi:hypothetical protein